MSSFPEMYNDPISFGAGEANLFNNQDIFFLVIIFYILMNHLYVWSSSDILGRKCLLVILS